MRPHFLCLALLLLVSLAPADFPDPAPPTSHPIGDITLPKPAPREGLLFHHAPKPLSKVAIVEDWPCFLGPRHNSTSTETHLLPQLPKEGPPVVWEISRGSGYSSPAVANGRVVILHRVKDDEIVECLDAETGQRYWQHTYPTAYEDRYGLSDGPRSMPVISGNLVFTMGVEGALHCLDLRTGHIYWKRDILAEFKLKPNFFGVGSTPLVDGDNLIVNVGADGGPCVAAFNIKTGKMVWGAGKDWGPSYASPIPATIWGKHRILIFAGGESRPATGGLLSLDPANGAIDFAFPWRGRRYESVNASSPLAIANQVFVSECYGNGGLLLNIDDQFKPKEAWTNDSFGTHFMTAIYKDGYLYGPDGHGPLDCPLVCVDAATGKEMWRAEPTWEETIQTKTGQRKLRLGTNLCQLVQLDGKTLCLTESGNLLYLDLNPKAYKEQSRCLLFAASESWTQPVLSHGLLYINQNSRDMATDTGPRLICYDLRGE